MANLIVSLVSIPFTGEAQSLAAAVNDSHGTVTIHIVPVPSE